VDDAVAEAGHRFQTLPECRVHDSGLLQDAEDIAIVGGTAQPCAGDHVVADVQARLDHDLDLSFDPGVSEAILAMAEKTSPPRGVRHPNGAIDLVEVLLCVAPESLASVSERYETYLGRAASASGRARVFPLEEARLTVVPSDGLADLLPGEQTVAVPALIGYAVTVRDLAEIEAFLRRQGFSPASTPAGDRLVSATAALGAAVIFRQAAAG
jgi:hypothetical protein